MPISGLSITLSDPSQAQTVCDALRNDSHITIGEVCGGKIAIVVETSSQLEDDRVRRWIGEISGISYVDITFISFDDTEE